MTTSDDMFESAYLGASRVLDDALGTDANAGTGMGLVADVALLAQRYGDLSTAIVQLAGSKGIAAVREIEARDLRDQGGGQ